MIVSLTCQWAFGASWEQSSFTERLNMKQTLYVSDGNRKMSLPTFSLPAKSTCPGCTRQCASHCYARKAEKAYPGVLPCRKRNLKLSRGDTFIDGMVDIIMSKSPKLFRIHESGDFYSQSYLEKWFTICEALPDTRFLAFTKSFHLDFTRKPSNLQIVWSIWPDTDLSRVPSKGPRAYAGDCQGMGKTVQCAGNCDSCGICWFLDRNPVNVHFDIH